MIEKIEALRKVVGDPVLYEVVCALRGPDLKRSWHLKTIFTWPIRWIAARLEFEFSLKVIFEYITPLNLSTVLNTLSDVEGDMEHYISHIKKAYRALSNIGILPKDICKYVIECIKVVEKVYELLRSGLKIDDIDIDRFFEPIAKQYEELYEKYMEKEEGDTL